MKRIVLATVVVLGVIEVAAVAAVSTESLLNDLTDLKRLAELPDPAYTTRQFSSYDRKSKSPTEDWFANGDAGQYLRIEDKQGRKEHVMMDAEGPGAIVRIWSANPKGTLRIYLDGGETPVIAEEMGKLLGGAVPGFPKPLAGERSRGWNLHFPIPYARSCKVTSDEGGFYYHVNYRTYAAGTQVESFSRGALDQVSSKAAAVAAKLASPRTASGQPADRRGSPFDVTLQPEEARTAVELSGPQAICGFWVKLHVDDPAEAARGVVLSMAFDGQETVQCPIGDFFGTAPGLTPYESLPCGIMPGDEPLLWCHWWMPFQKSARLSLRNLTGKPVQVKGEAQACDSPWSDRSLLFHAKWRIERDLPTRPFTDWAHLECRGHGRFVGGALHVINPVRHWWGEGDEKIYVDGEAFPSHFGTGTEDYYGYAWCCPERFVHAYHNQPRCDGPGNYGNTSVNRFHIIDDIPFTRQFKFDIENWHSQEHTKTTRAAVSYWYARPGGSDFFKPLTKDDVRLDRIEPYKSHEVPGALEGEKMKVLEKTGEVVTQQLDERFSSEAHLWWTKGKPGDKLVLAFDVEAGGRKHVIVRLTKAVDYGQVQLYVNDQKAGGVLDLYNDGVVPTDAIDLGAFDLTKGRNKLTAEIVGANEKAVKAYMFGLDYLLLK